MTRLTLAVFPDDPGRIVRLVTGDQVAAAPGLAWWSVALAFMAIAAVGALAGVVIWRLRTSDFDAQERAFVALARRQGLGAGTRAMLRRAAEAKGCAAVALLVSRHALEDAIKRLSDARSEADARSVEAGGARRAPLLTGIEGR